MVDEDLIVQVSLYLDDLRESSRLNLDSAVKNIQEKFNIPNDTATNLLTMWLDGFDNWKVF